MERYCNIGFDICEVQRIQRSIQRWSFVKYHFTDSEIDYCELAPESLRAQRYAARWAAKEAMIKALRGSMFSIPFTDIFVLHHTGGAPFIYLEGKARSKADSLGITNILTSIAHEKRLAGAACLVIGGTDIPDDISASFSLLQTALKTGVQRGR